MLSDTKKLIYFIRALVLEMKVYFRSDIYISYAAVIIVNTAIKIVFVVCGNMLLGLKFSVWCSR